jgi:uncharacterized membrane protein YbhN (UPF0104 family)
MSQSEPRRSLPTLWNILKIILALVLVGFVLSRTDLAQLFALRERISLPWLAAGIILYFTLTLLKAMQYYFFIGRRVNYPQVLNIVVVQNAVSNFIATGAGIASFFALFRVEQGVKISRAALAFVLAKVADLISIWLFLLVTGSLVWQDVKALHQLIFILLIGIGGAILVFFLGIFLRQKFISLLQGLVDSFKLNRLGIVIKGMDIMRSLAEQEHGFVFRMIGTGILFSLVYMAVTMLWIYSGFKTFAFEIGALPVIFVNVFMQLVSYLPIQAFGGLGVNETTMLYLYTFFQFPQAELASVLIGARLLFYLTNLVVLIYLPVYSFFSNRSHVLPEKNAKL